MKSKRQRDDGLRKICACRSWTSAKCDHPWYFSVQGQGQAPRARIAGPLQRAARREDRRGEGACRHAPRRRGCGHLSGARPCQPEPIAVVTFADCGGSVLEDGADPEGQEPGQAARDERSADDRQAVRLDASGASAPLGQHSPADVTEDVLEAFTAHLREQGRAASTVSNYIQLIKAIDRWLAQKGYRSAPAVSGEADGLRRGKATKRRPKARPRHDRRARPGDTGGRRTTAPEGCAARGCNG